MKRLFAGFAIGLLTLGLIPHRASAQATDSAKFALLRGTVYDSVHHVPLADANVIAIETESRGAPSITQAHADAKGAFEFRALAPGRYTLSVESAALDSAGLSVADVDRTLDAGTMTQLLLATPSRRTRVRLACGAPLADTTLGAILGVVRDVTTGRPLSRAVVVLQWSDFSVDSTARFHTQGKLASVTTDSTGTFRACGVPAQRSVFLQAQLGARNSGIVQEQINESGVLARDFAVVTDTAARGYGATNVTVVDADGHPISAAQVRLVGTTRSLAVQNDGRVHIDSLPLGTEQLEVVAVGFYPERRTLDVADHAQRALSITMEKQATVLESMRIVANANNPKYREFEEHRKQGWGDFYTDQDIAKRQIFDLSDFFTVLRHVDAHVSNSGHRYLTMGGFGNRGISTILGGANNPVAASLERRDSSFSRLPPPPPITGMGGTGVGACQPAVFVNGVLANGDGESGDALDAIPSRFVHGLEVYDDKFSPVPAQYRNPGNCGAIVVWTK